MDNFDHQFYIIKELSGFVTLDRIASGSDSCLSRAGVLFCNREETVPGHTVASLSTVQLGSSGGMGMPAPPSPEPLLMLLVGRTHGLDNEESVLISY
jgi:hypothetical protein